MSEEIQSATTLLPIGAVTRMTGVSAHTLRKWESRYQLVTPQRTDTDRRLYSEDDVERLLVIRELVNDGIQPSHLMGLDEASLKAMRGRTARPASKPAQTGPITVIGTVVASSFRLAPAEQVRDVDVLYSAERIESWLDGTHPIDGCVVLEVHSLQRADARNIISRAQSAGARLLVVYGYASRPTQQLLTDAGITCLKAPCEVSEMLSALAGPVDATTGTRSPSAAPRRYSDEQIAKLAAISTSIECECPTHVAQLLTSINAFHQYSAECSDADPQQRELHRYLEQVAASARTLFEDAVQRVADTEGIEI